MHCKMVTTRKGVFTFIFNKYLWMKGYKLKYDERIAPYRIKKMPIPDDVKETVVKDQRYTAVYNELLQGYSLLETSIRENRVLLYHPKKQEFIISSRKRVKPERLKATVKPEPIHGDALYFLENIATDIQLEE